MTKSVTLPLKDGKIRGTVNDFLKDLLNRHIVEAVMAPVTLSGKKNVAPSLVTDPDYLDDADVFAPVFPVLTSRIVVAMTKLAAATQKTAVIIRPCDLRALTELVKLKQARLENLIIISFDCAGAYPIQYYGDWAASNTSDEFMNTAWQGKEDESLRSGCKICAFQMPLTADLTISSIGIGMKDGLVLKAGTEQGEQVLEALEANVETDSAAVKQREAAVEKLLAETEKKRQKFFEKTREEVGGIENLAKALETCIKCHNCKTICPVCYCRECLFDSPTFDLEAERYLASARKQGAIRMPADTVLFHLTRMTHMGASCIGCSACEEACPSGIPLLKLFQMTGDSVQKLFDYIPGRSLDDPLPMATFREEELEWIGEK